MNDTDQYLAAIVAADAGAFAKWMAVAEPEVRLSLRAFAAVVDVESLVQETLLRVWQVAARHEPDGKPNSLLRLAMRIARNLAISETRRTRPADLGPDGFEAHLNALAAGRTESLPDPLLRRWIQHCRDQLPNKPAQALAARLSARGGQSDDDLAAALRMAKNTFLQNFTRARKLMAECLQRRGVDLGLERS